MAVISTTYCVDVVRPGAARGRQGIADAGDAQPPLGQQCQRAGARIAGYADPVAPARLDVRHTGRRPRAFPSIAEHHARRRAAGFVVSIAWISTIASQVVGALKALAVICNMSHAIMGLTIFAVGNSLGDLVADITVAKLGYPVMALSACFGGPMLNILLGIGLSGSYILVTGAHHHQHKHPGSELRYKSYQIEVGRTLIVTGFTLLLTLVGLLIAVPLNKWVLSKRIGVALIALWVTTTIINVALELTGWGTEGSDN